VKATLLAAAAGVALSMFSPMASTPQAGAQDGASAAVGEAEQETFAAWLADFRRRALAAGHNEAATNAVLDGLEPNARVVELDGDQPEFVRPIWEYLDSAVSESRITNGTERGGQTATILAALEERYAIDRAYLVALWGLESAYGGYIGDFDAPRSLATLAWEGRRRALFERELLAVIDIVASGDADRGDFTSGWAGALGQTQFMPTAFIRYAVDFDGDGKKNIWSNRGDALASAANYVSDHGWRQGEPWGAEVRVPSSYDYASADGRRRSVGGWAVSGLVRADGEPWGPTEQFMQAKLLLPAGANGPAFLTFANFEVFKRYNNSTSYALAAGLLGDALAGKTALLAPWPRDERPLARSEVEELQRLLNRLGYNTNGVDGLVGPNTRAALRAFQTARELAADAFPTGALLERARADAEIR